MKFHGQVEWRAIFSKAGVLTRGKSRITRGAFQATNQGWTLDLRGLERGRDTGVDVEVSQVTPQ